MSVAPSANEDSNDAAPTEATRSFRSWSLVLASLLFSAATFEMGRLYSIIHWDIMWKLAMMKRIPAAENPDVSQLPEGIFAAFSHLAYLRAIFALLAFVWAIWSFRTCPRWASFIALVFSLGALMTMLIMT
jgi:hypothetical protein